MNMPYNRRSDVFADWLDAQVTGMSTPDHELEADSELADVCAAADQFHGLDQRLGQYATFVSPRSTSWEDIMRTHAGSLAITGSPVEIPRESRSIVPFDRKAPAWERVLSVVLAAVVVLTLGAGVLRVADISPIGGDEPPATTPFGGFGLDDGGDPGRIAPVATVGVDQESSSIPYPTADECTVEPLSRDEVVAHLTLANMATEPEYARYEQTIEPSAEDAAAIMRTFRMSQACHLNDRAFAYGMGLETPWYTADQSPLFLINGRPVSDELIEEFADIAIADGGSDILWPPVYGTPPADGPEGMDATPDMVPIPDGATPVAFPTNSAGNAPTIFAEDIMITGPDTARATVYFVNTETLEVSIHSPNVWYEFVKVDGQWLLDAYHQSQGGG